MKALALKDLSEPNSICIMNNYWVVERRRELIPIPGFIPKSSLRDVVEEMIEVTFGPKFHIVKVPIAYIPKGLV